MEQRNDEYMWGIGVSFSRAFVPLAAILSTSYNVTYATLRILKTLWMRYKKEIGSWSPLFLKIFIFNTNHNMLASIRIASLLLFYTAPLLVGIDHDMWMRIIFHIRFFIFIFQFSIHMFSPVFRKNDRGSF